LPALAEKALRRKALGLLGLLKKQGKIISGISKSADSLKKNKVLLLLVADSAKNYGSDDVRNLGSNVLTADCFSLTELQSALSNGNSMHVVLKGDALALRCFDEIRKLLIYLERIELNDK
jgi:hypothetical protein